MGSPGKGKAVGKLLTWGPNKHYGVGDQVGWHGIRLVCTRAHFCPAGHRHPWDPAATEPEAYAATLWTPASPEDAKQLLLRASRVRCAVIAATPETR